MFYDHYGNCHLELDLSEEEWMWAEIFAAEDGMALDDWMRKTILEQARRELDMDGLS